MVPHRAPHRKPANRESAPPRLSPFRPAGPTKTSGIAPKPDHQPRATAQGSVTHPVDTRRTRAIRRRRRRPRRTGTRPGQPDLAMWSASAIRPLSFLAFSSCCAARPSRHRPRATSTRAISAMRVVLHRGDHVDKDLRCYRRDQRRPLDHRQPLAGPSGDLVVTIRRSVSTVERSRRTPRAAIRRSRSFCE